MTNRWIIGLASGSSTAGVSAALVETACAGLDLQVRPVLTLHQPYARDLRELIRRSGSSAQAEVKQICLLHRLVGETFAAAARQVADRGSLSLQKVHCIGCQGHTLWHEPDGRFPSTVELGMPAIVAERTGVTTISDLRARDLAVGGHGMSLEALADYLLFRHASEDRVLIHLGGLASVVFLPAGGRPQQAVGFEIGPCNLLLDGLIRQLTAGREEYDPGGKYAVQGRCLEPLLSRWLSNPYFLRRPPKSVPRSSFVEEFVLQGVQYAHHENCAINDVLCSAAHFVARNVGAALARFLAGDWPADRAILSGGGTRNGLLWHLVEQHLSGIPVDKTDRFGVPSDSREAIGCAILAAFTLDGVPGNLSSATGAAGPRMLGSLTPGSSTNWARCLEWMAGQTVPVTVGDD